VGSGKVIDEVKSASDLLSGLDAGFGIHELILFRGQRQVWPLLPKIARLAEPSVKNTPNPDLEREMINEFRWRARPQTQGSLGDNLWEWLALAQHYGMPTRLLDWTTNPLAALWFAVREPEVSESDGPGVVWLFVPDGEDRIDPIDCPGNCPLEIERTRVFRPSRITPRIIAQSGWFTTHRRVPQKKDFISLETDAEYKDKIVQYHVPKASFGRIREELARLDIHSASMFPDLGGLGSYVKWRYILDEDE
jgi:hypothetical protein